MVQKSRTASIVLAILVRVFLLAGIMILAVFSPIQLHDFIVNDLGFVNPGGFFGFSLADWEVTWVFSLVLLSGIIFGVLGKKIDYFFISLIFLFGIYDYSVPLPASYKMYAVLLSAAILGNVIGFYLKLARQRFLPGIKI